MTSLFSNGISMSFTRTCTQTQKFKGDIIAARGLFWDLHRFDHEHLRCLRRSAFRKYQHSFSFFFSMKHSLIPATKPAKPARKFRCGRFILKRKERVDVTPLYKQ